MLSKQDNDAVQDYECFFIHIGDEQQNDQLAASKVEGWSGILIDRDAISVSKSLLERHFEDTLSRDKASINMDRFLNGDINGVTSLKSSAMDGNDLSSALHVYFNSTPVSARKDPGPFIINDLNQLAEVIDSFVQTKKREKGNLK